MVNGMKPQGTLTLSPEGEKLAKKRLRGEVGVQQLRGNSGLVVPFNVCVPKGETQHDRRTCHCGSRLSQANNRQKYPERFGGVRIK